MRGLLPYFLFHHQQHIDTGSLKLSLRACHCQGALVWKWPASLRMISISIMQRRKFIANSLRGLLPYFLFHHQLHIDADSFGSNARACHDRGASRICIQEGQPQHYSHHFVSAVSFQLYFPERCVSMVVAVWETYMNSFFRQTGNPLQNFTQDFLFHFYFTERCISIGCLWSGCAVGVEWMPGCRYTLESIFQANG